LLKAKTLYTALHQHHLSTNCTIEGMHTLTLFYLAQVVGRAGSKAESAKYCEMTLARQIESGDALPVDWMSNCCSLVDYYLTLRCFRKADLCLKGAEEVAKEAVRMVPPDGEDPSASTGESAAAARQKAEEHKKAALEAAQ
jgi:hypothetical protein